MSAIREDRRNEINKRLETIKKAGPYSIEAGTAREYMDLRREPEELSGLRGLDTTADAVIQRVIDEHARGRDPGIASVPERFHAPIRVTHGIFGHGTMTGFSRYGKPTMPRTRMSGWDALFQADSGLEFSFAFVEAHMRTDRALGAGGFSLRFELESGERLFFNALNETRS